MSFVARGRVDCKDFARFPDFRSDQIEYSRSLDTGRSVKTSRELIWMELPLTRISRFECFEMVLGATKLVGLTRGTMSTQRRGYSGSAWGDPKTKLAWEIQPGRRLCWRRRGGVLVKWFLAKTVVFHPPTSKS